MNMRLIIQQLTPNAHCSGPGPRDGNEWRRWKWDDPRPKPKWAAIQAAWAAIEPTLPDPEQETAIRAEADRYAYEQARIRLGLQEATRA